MRIIAPMILTIATTAALGASAFVPYTTDAGTPLAWPYDAAIALHVGDAPGGAMPATLVAPMLEDALALWLETPCPDPARVDVRPPLPDVTLAPGVLDTEDRIVSVAWIADANAWNQRFGQLELARTILIHKVVSGAIVDADIAVNLGNFEFAAGAACDPDRYDLAAMFTHELGHVLGLDHSEVATATMAAKTDAGECGKRDLDPDDVAGICATYSRPAPPEPDPEPVVERVEPPPEPAIEPAPPARDEGCGAAPDVGLAVLGLGVASALALRRARRASGGCRR